MSKVKIYLSENETLEEAEADLYKAYGYHVNGEAHSKEDFKDPAMKDVANHMEDVHKKMYKDLLQEVFEILDKDYSKNGY